MSFRVRLSYQYVTMNLCLLGFFVAVGETFQSVTNSLKGELESQYGLYHNLSEDMIQV